MRARWVCRPIAMRGQGPVVHAEINADPLKGGPYVEHSDGGTSITYYGKPGGRVEINLTSAELAELKAQL